MRIWLEKMAWKTQRLMQGRNGQDELCRALLITAFILLILNCFAASPVISILATALLIWSMFRVLSRNIAKRQKELQVYYNIIKYPKNFIKTIKLNHSDKQHKHYMCRCATIMRVPSGRGKIVINCPKCHRNHNKRS